MQDHGCDIIHLYLKVCVIIISYIQSCVQVLKPFRDKPLKMKICFSSHQTHQYPSELCTCTSNSMWRVKYFSALLSPACPSIYWWGKQQKISTISSKARCFIDFRISSSLVSIKPSIISSRFWRSGYLRVVRAERGSKMLQVLYSLLISCKRYCGHHQISRSSCILCLYTYIETEYTQFESFSK